MHPIQAADTGIDGGSDDGDVCDLLVLEHGIPREEVGVGGGLDLPHHRGFHPRLKAHVVDDLTPRGLVPTDPLALGLLELGKKGRDFRNGGDLPLGHLLKTPLDDGKGLAYLKEAYHDPVVDVPAGLKAVILRGDGLDPQVPVNQVRPVLAHVLTQARGPGSGPHRAQFLRLLRLQHPHVPGTGLHRGIVQEPVAELLKKPSVITDHLPHPGVLLRGNVPPHPPVDRDGVIHSVPSELLQDVQHLLPHLPGEVKQGVEPQLVGRHPSPQKMRVDALKLGDDHPDVLGSGGDLDPSGVLHRLDEGDGMGDGADPADALGKVQDLDQVPVHAHKLDPPVGEARFYVHPHDPLPLHLEGEPDLFL